MATCGYCGSTIFFGGVRAGEQRFCNDRCHQGAYVLSVAKQLPAEILERHVEEVFRGNCPSCRSLGPVDVHKIHRVWSALVLTSWSTTPKVCCRSCAVKAHLGGILYSFVLGWWGFPWGLILTPVQIGRNIVGMCHGEPSQPSADLRKLVQVNLGLQAIQQAQASKPPPLPS